MSFGSRFALVIRAAVDGGRRMAVRQKTAARVTNAYTMLLLGWQFARRLESVVRLA